MLMTTTALVEGRHITKYHGVVTGEAIIGANVVRDLFAGLRDFFGGRSGSYEEVLRKAKDTALQEMGEEAARLGANAVIGIDLDYETECKSTVPACMAAYLLSVQRKVCRFAGCIYF